MIVPKAPDESTICAVLQDATAIEYVDVTGLANSHASRILKDAAIGSVGWANDKLRHQLELCGSRAG